MKFTGLDNFFSLGEKMQKVSLLLFWVQGDWKDAVIVKIAIPQRAIRTAALF